MEENGDGCDGTDAVTGKEGGANGQAVSEVVENVSEEI